MASKRVGFQNEPILRPLAHRKWITEIPLAYVSRLPGVGLLVVPAQFVSDLNSLPRPLWWFALPSDFAACGILHDWACRNMVRCLADALYREALQSEGMGVVRRNVRYLGVRVGGWLGIGIVN